MLIRSIHTFGRKILDLDSYLSWLWHSPPAPGAEKQMQRQIFSCSASRFHFLVSVQTKLSLFHVPFIYIYFCSLYMCKCDCVYLYPQQWHTTSSLHVRLHPLCVSVGIIGMLGSVGEPCGTSVFPESRLWGSGTASSPDARPHPVHLVRWPTFQWGEAGWSKTHPKRWIVWRVAVIIVS